MPDPVQTTGPRLLRTVTLSGMRATIARRMTESLQSSAQLTLNRELDPRPLVAFRRRLREGREHSEVTYNDLILLAVARTLDSHMNLNATLEGNQISFWQSINIGVAVSVEAGLMVPVIQDCGEKSLGQIAAAARDLAERARAGRLGMSDVLGGTFTVSNLGAFGVDHFTPIINPPQVAIVGVGRIREDRLTLSLTIDHRVVDGAEGGQYLSTLAAALEDPATLRL